jgi:hypothetical protein
MLEGIENLNYMGRKSIWYGVGSAPTVGPLCFCNTKKKRLVELDLSLITKGSGVDQILTF